jgi:hypothetical protein
MLPNQKGERRDYLEASEGSVEIKDFKLLVKECKEVQARMSAYSEFQILGTATRKPPDPKSNLNVVLLNIYCLMNVANEKSRDVRFERRSNVTLGIFV